MALPFWGPSRPGSSNAERDAPGTNQASHETMEPAAELSEEGTMLVINQNVIAALCRRRRVRRLAIFGSAMTDRFDPQSSDADFLVEFEGSSGSHFDDYFGLKEDLEAVLGRPVDLVTKSALENPYFAESVTANLVEIYAA